MANDYGLRISPRVLHGPLWTLSPRALRLWMYLAMKSQHATQRFVLADGQKVAVNRGQWLTSQRKLATEARYASPKAVIADLRDLTTAGVISTQPIIRQRFQNDTTSGSKLESGGRFQNGTTGIVLATLITVNGINHLVEGGGSKLEAKEQESDLRRLSPADREWVKADAALRAEGR